MTIKKCPGCVQYIHFDFHVGFEKCWNCGLLTDFSQLKSPEERLILLLENKLSVIAQPFSERVHFRAVGKAALVMALPVAVTMLLICNSLNISIVHDPTAPFSSSRPYPVSPFDSWPID